MTKKAIELAKTKEVDIAQRSLTLNVEPLSKIPQGGEPLNLSSYV